jgi:hypothetical protein
MGAMETVPVTPITFPAAIFNPGYLYVILLNVANPIYTTPITPPGVITTDAQGLYAVGLDLAASRNGDRFHMQCLEFPPINIGAGFQFPTTNVVPMVVP